MRTLVWFRGKDLRIADHAPLTDAARAGEVIPLFVLDPYFFAPARAQAMPHRMQFLLDALRSLSENLRARGSRLVVVAGRSVDVVPELAAKWRVDRVVAHRWTEPVGRERDRRVAAVMRVPLKLYEGETLKPPSALRTGAGAPFSVYTPFARAFLAAADIAAPLPAPKTLPPLPVEAREVPISTLAELGIEKNPRVQEGGERAGRDRLRAFMQDRAQTYEQDRDRMDRDGTSRLSADLKFGTVSVRTIWREAESALGPGARKFHSELLWREFTHMLLWHQPELLQRPFRPAFEGFPWRDDHAAFTAWAEGRTGYPIVDAAAHELRATGYVHNRARMIAASFLTKHLLLDYRRGEAHYMRWLTDGDAAQNNAGWQWSAGCGCDAQPYFRVFNPELQARRFDPEGVYVRRWAPEPVRPIVDHKAARARFLAVAKAHLASAHGRELADGA